MMHKSATQNQSPRRPVEGIHPLDESFDFSRWASLVRRQMVASLQKRAEK
jgi:hypothetical protein